MADEKTQSIPKPLPSLLESGPLVVQNRSVDEIEELFYTCPQCGHPMAVVKCEINCDKCHYFIGCVE